MSATIVQFEQISLKTQSLFQKTELIILKTELFLEKTLGFAKLSSAEAETLKS